MSLVVMLEAKQNLSGSHLVSTNKMPHPLLITVNTNRIGIESSLSYRYIRASVGSCCATGFVPCIFLCIFLISHKIAHLCVSTFIVTHFKLHLRTNIILLLLQRTQTFSRCRTLRHFLMTECCSCQTSLQQPGMQMFAEMFQKVTRWPSGVQDQVGSIITVSFIFRFFSSQLFQYVPNHSVTSVCEAARSGIEPPMAEVQCASLCMRTVSSSSALLMQHIPSTFLLNGFCCSGNACSTLGPDQRCPTGHFD